MKFLDKIIIILSLLIVFVAIILWSYRCGSGDTDPCPPDGMQLVPDSFIDSLQWIASQVPDTIIDTVFIVTPGIQSHHSEPVEEITDEDMELYFSNDSLITPFYKVWVTDWIQNNDILYRDWNYTIPDKTTIIKKVEKPVLYPVTLDHFKKKAKSHYITIDGGIGMGTAGIPFKVGIDYISQKNIKYGLSYTYYNNQGFIMADLGLVVLSW